MVTTTYVGGERVTSYEGVPVGGAEARSGVSWAAIFAGALAAGVLSLLLFLLGIGLGLSSISVWSGKGADGQTIGLGAIVWLVVTQLASAAVGGYLAGRLRTKWQGVHTDEVYFRDTAHGFLAWALATIVMVALMGTVVGSAISGATKAASTVASGAAQAVGGAVSAVSGAAGGAASAAIAGSAGAATGKALENTSRSDLDYWINTLVRNGGPTEQQKQEAKDTANEVARKARSAAEDAREITVIFTHSLQNGQLSDGDAQYVARLVSQRANISTDEAKQKVQKSFDEVQQQIEKVKQAAKEAEEKAKEAAEQARKATAYSMLWMFVVLMIGAFVGSVSATIGGRQRGNA